MAELAPRDARITKLEAALERIAHLEEENRQLREENRQLKERLNLNSSNSSKPPSSDAPGTPRPTKKPTGRSPGASRDTRSWLSKRLVKDALSDMLGVDVPVGSVVNLEGEMPEALCPAVAEARVYVQAADKAHADETGWVEGRKEGRGQRAWL